MSNRNLQLSSIPWSQCQSNMMGVNGVKPAESVGRQIYNKSSANSYSPCSLNNIATKTSNDSMNKYNPATMNGMQQQLLGQQLLGQQQSPTIEQMRAAQIQEWMGQRNSNMQGQQPIVNVFPQSQSKDGTRADQTVQYTPKSRTVSNLRQQNYNDNRTQQQVSKYNQNSNQTPNLGASYQYSYSSQPPAIVTNLANGFASLFGNSR